jgi:tetratricopeptide (TPR) repeat protein
MKHALVVAVAVGYVVVSLADGGYPPEAIAAGTLLIWWAVIVGLAVGAWPRAGIPRPAIAAGLCIVGLGLLTGLSLGWSNDDGRTFIEVVRVAGYAGLFVLVILTSSTGSARTWLIGLAIGLTAVAVLALGSRLEPAFPCCDEHLARFIPGAEGRLSYPIGYWNGLGACVALGGVLLVWLGARADTRLGRALAIGALPALLLTLYPTSSRGGVIALAIGLLVLLGRGPARLRLAGGAALAIAGGAALIALADMRSALVDHPNTAVAQNAGDEILLATLLVCGAVGVARHLVDVPLARPPVPRLAVPRLAIRIAVVALAFLALAGVAVADPAGRFDDFKQPPDDTDVSTHLSSASGSGRYQFWSAAFDAFEHEPITGIGAGGYEEWWNQHGSIPRILRDAHSLFFETLAELGIGGLLLLLSFLALGAVHGWRRRAGGSPGGATEVALALLAVGVFSAAGDWTWELSAAFAPVVVVVALLTGPATLGRGRAAAAGDGAGAPAQGGRSFGWGVATLLTGWVALWIAGLLLLTEVKLDDSRAAVDRGDLAAAAQDASDASTLQPWAAEPRLQRALVEERAGNLPAARVQIGEAIDRAPEDWSLWYAASRIEFKAGDRAAYGAAYERARELNPRAPLFTRNGGARPPAPTGSGDQEESGRTLQRPEVP